MFFTLNIISSAFWLVSYLLIMRRAHIDKSFGFPMASTCTDLSWVVIFTLIFFNTWMMAIFVVIDVIFMAQLVRYRHSDFENWSNFDFYGALALCQLLSFGAILAFAMEFDDPHGIFTIFADVLVASVAFVVMIQRRNDVRGQSVYIALTKMIGTAMALATFHFYPVPDMATQSLPHLTQSFRPTLALETDRYQHSELLLFFSISIFVLDAIYVALVYRKCRAQAIDPWRRL